MSSKDSKTNFASLREQILGKSGKDYWRSVEEYSDSPAFSDNLKYEHPAQADTWDDSSLSRRNFVKVMGASLALAGLSGCVIQPSEKIVPYVIQPEEIIPGKPLFYATSMTLGGVATGLLARSNEGRPTKIEGNPEHPGSLGATDVFAQASILDMYDPDRSKEVVFRGEPKTWQAFMTEFRRAVDEHRGDGGAGIRILSETVSSPTQIAQFEALRRELPNVKWYQYEPLNRDSSTAGAKMAFGSAVNTVYKLDHADRILLLDADIFSGFNVRYMKDFAKKRSMGHGEHGGEHGGISRLYAVETTLTLAGAKADHRLAVKPSQMIEVAKAIAAALGVSGASSNYKENATWIASMAKDLLANKGKTVVIAGENQSPMVHALAFAMNQALEAVGKTVVYTEPVVANAEVPQIDQLRELVKDIDAGQVKMLVMLGGNPAYNTPADLKLNKERFDKIALRVHLGHYQDETAELCHWHLSEKHYLEMWSDTRAFDGTVSITQPLIDPLYASKSATELVQLFFKESFEKKDYDIVREYWQKQTFNMTPKPVAETEKNNEAKAEPKAETKTDAKVAAPAAVAAATTPAPAASPAAATAVSKDFEANWRKIVHDGYIPNTEAKPKAVTLNPAFLSTAAPAPASGAIEFAILPDPSIYDGRFANNGWLQELPNPLNKVTWENVALVSPKTAAKLGLNTKNSTEDKFVGGAEGTSFIDTRGGNAYSDLVKVKFQGAEMTNPVPVWIAPGQPDDVVTMFLGYGRTRAGRVGNGLGYNAYEIRRSDALYFGAGEITKTGETTTVASTQIHFNMEGRDILRIRDVADLEKYKEADHQHDEYKNSMYDPEEFQKLYNENNRWGMAIDLNNCVGCNACVIACQSENNIPVVGKEQVERSREMHWIRIDAYYGGTPESPNGPAFQPVICQQCEQAPCEVVCPVHATVHSAEGLNDMVYNRCIGTRYCSNNCPYKVRRFNFLLYQDWNTPEYKLMRNPDVSIRSRGVMEKCTYCTQRISSARIEAEKDGRAIRDGEVMTACQAACPTDAITFGNINDKTSAIAKKKEDHREYNLLNELNTQPRTTYLAALKNMNREIEQPPKDFLPVDKYEKTKG